MSEQLQLRRGTEAQIEAFTGAQGETTPATDTMRLHVHDGVTAGGWPHALETYTVVNDAAYTALITDRMIVYTALTASRSVTLPAAANYPTGAELVIMDGSGNCAAGMTITANGAGSDKINGVASEVIAVAYGSIRLVSNGSGWVWSQKNNATPVTQGDR